VFARSSVRVLDCVRSVRGFVVGLGGGVIASNIQQVSEQLEARNRHLTT
jgi:hypothetical protein